MRVQPFGFHFWWAREGPWLPRGAIFRLVPILWGGLEVLGRLPGQAPLPFSETVARAFCGSYFCKSVFPWIRLNGNAETQKRVFLCGAGSGGLSKSRVSVEACNRIYRNLWNRGCGNTLFCVDGGLTGSCFRGSV